MHYSCSTTVLLKPLTFCLWPSASPPLPLPHLPCLSPFASALSRAHNRGVMYRDRTGMGQCLWRTRMRCKFETGVEERAMRVGSKLTCVQFAAELRRRRPAIPLPAEATEATQHACWRASTCVSSCQRAQNNSVVNRKPNAVLGGGGSAGKRRRMHGARRVCVCNTSRLGRRDWLPHTVQEVIGRDGNLHRGRWFLPAPTGLLI